MSSAGSQHGPHKTGRDDWLREVEDALRGHRPRVARRRSPSRAPRSIDDYLGEGGVCRDPSEAARGPLDGRPAEDLRVWDVWKPHIVPGASIAIVGLLVVGGILLGFKWFSASYSGPSHQATFEAIWGAHRRGDDIATPEALEEASADESNAATSKTPPEAESEPTKTDDPALAAPVVDEEE